MNNTSSNIQNTQSTLAPRRIKGLNVIGLYTLVWREVGRFLSVYMQTLVAPVVTTLLFYTVFALAFGGVAREINGVPFLQFLIPGLIMMTMVQNAFANTSSSLVISKIQGNIVDILMPPLSSLELFLGFIIGGITRGLMVGIVTIAIVRIFVPFEIYSWGLVFGFAILGTFMLAALGVIGGILADKFDHMAAFTNFVITPLTFLSGTFYSVQSLPELWRGIALYNPFFYMIDGFRRGFIGQGDGSAALGLIMLCGINVFLSAVILWMFKTGFKTRA